MKKNLLSLLVVIAPLTAITQPTLDYVNTKTISTNLAGYNSAIETTIDVNKNVISVGTFTGTTDFDPNAGVNTLTVSGTSNGFIQKLDPSGNFLWVKQIVVTGSFGFVPNQIETNSAGEIYLAGYFNQTIDCDPGAGVTSFTSGAIRNPIFMKFSSSGNLVWAKHFNCSHDSYNIGFTLDETSGKCLVYGSFNTGTIDVDPGANTTLLTSAGGGDGYAIMLDINGNYLSRYQIGSTGIDIVNGAAINDIGEIILVGGFAGTVDFDQTASVSTMTANILVDGFAVKYSPAGTLLWNKKFEGNSYDFCSKVKINALNETIISGYVNDGNIDLDPSASVALFDNGFSLGAFLVKLDYNGDYLSHAGLIGGTNHIKDFIIHPDQRIIACGDFSQTVDFDPSAGFSYVSASAGFTGEYFWILNENLALEDVKIRNDIATSGDLGPSSISISDPIIIVSGSFGGTFDMDPINVDNHTSVGTFDNYISKFSLCNSDTTFTTTANCGSYNWPVSGTTYNSSGLYTHVLTSAYGCDSIIGLNLTIQNLPNTGVVNNGSGTFTSSDIVGNVAFQWIDCNNSFQVISGETDQSFTPSVNGSYAVIVTGLNGCTDTSACEVIQNVGLNELENDNFKIYPNPFSTSTTLSFEDHQTNTNIIVLDALGKELMAINFSGTEMMIYNQKWNSGIYFIQITNQEGIVLTKKIQVL